MLLVSTGESQMERATEEMLTVVAEGHRAVQEEARRAGAFVAADPLARTSTASARARSLTMHATYLRRLI